MSSLIIHALHKRGDLIDIHSTKEIGYSSYITRVEMALEKKYLPKHVSKYGIKSRCFEVPDFENGECKLPYHQEIWDLIQDKRLTRNERIVLGFYFTLSFSFGNKAELINAFKSFDKEHETETSCVRIAEIIENDTDIDHVGYRIYASTGDEIFEEQHNEETDETTYYNWKKQDEHFDLFQYIDEIEASF